MSIEMKYPVITTHIEVYEGSDGLRYEIIKTNVGLGYRIEWFVNNKFHRTNGPARIIYQEDGTIGKEWMSEGLLHRCGGPATITKKDNITLNANYYWKGKFIR